MNTFHDKVSYSPCLLCSVLALTTFLNAQDSLFCSHTTLFTVTDPPVCLKVWSIDMNHNLWPWRWKAEFLTCTPSDSCYSHAVCFHISIPWFVQLPLPGVSYLTSIFCLPAPQTPFFAFLLILQDPAQSHLFSVAFLDHSSLYLLPYH